MTAATGRAAPPTPEEIEAHTEPDDHEGQRYLARIGSGVPVVVRLWAVTRWDSASDSYVPTGEQRGECEATGACGSAAEVIAGLYATRWWRWADGPCDVGDVARPARAKSAG